MKPELSYIRSGDYWIPDLRLESTEQRPLNKYGRMRRSFLQKHRPVQYSTMKSMERQVGRTSEEFGKAILREQEQMKRTSRKLFWISMIPSLILVVWELTRHIWLLS